ncbi:cytochrome b [Pseudomonas syringae]|uniref:cytochrome b n=1 Tax=Pseudomonas syringae TaxID=317 RepID=UPI003F753B78
MQTVRSTYSKTAKFLHWVMAAGFIVAWAIGFYSATFLSYNDAPELKYALIVTHKNISTALLFLAFVRFFWRYTHPAPSLPSSMSPLMKKLAHVGHLVIYVALLLLPISGCILSWTSGYPVPVLFAFTLPALVGADKTWAPIAAIVHEYLTLGAGFVIAGHIAVALKHHFIDKDGVLNTMLCVKR